MSYARNYGMEIHITRLHNIFGPEGPWEGGGEKAPAAMARKVAEAKDGGEMEIWGDGEQTRTFLYIDGRPQLGAVCSRHGEPSSRNGSVLRYACKSIHEILCALV